MLFTAVHLYPPSSCLPVMFKGNDTGLLSETRVQVMLAVGLATAVQFRTTGSLSFTVWLTEMSTMSGGSGNKEKPYAIKEGNKVNNRK